MKRTELINMAKKHGLLRRDDKGKKILPPKDARKNLRAELVSYFKDTPEGQAAWDRRPRITGEGVADYVTIESMADALLLEVE